MSEPNTDIPKGPYLTREFFENQKNFPREQLDPFRGEYIAWSWEGDRVVGHAPTAKSCGSNSGRRGSVFTTSSSITWTLNERERMSLIYSYAQVRMRRPVHPLGGRMTRPRALIAFQMIGPLDTERGPRSARHRGG